MSDNVTQRKRDEGVSPAARLVVAPGNLAVIDHTLLPLLAPALTVRVFEFEVGGAAGHRRVDAEAQLFALDDGGRLLVPAGLVPRCRAELEAQGHRVEVQDLREFGPRHRSDESVIEKAKADDRAFLTAVASEPLGQVEVRGFRDSVRRITQLRRLFSRARIAVGVSTRRELWRYWRALEEYLKERVGLVDADHSREGRRVAVCTHLYGSVIDDAEILVLADAARATGKATAEQGFWASFQRVYGLVTPGRTDHRTALMVEALCGPPLYRLGSSVAGVHVVTVKTPPCKNADGLVGLERKRKVYWKNAARNKCVARVVRAFMDRDAKELGRLGVIGKGVKLKTSFWLSQIIILVESTEHGRELIKLLPEVAMLDGTPKEADENTEPNAHFKPLIVTTFVAARKGIRADVLIRATGGSSPFNVQGFPPDAGEAERDVLLVDFDDDFDVHAKSDTSQRTHDYQARGFPVEWKIQPKRVKQ